VSCRYWFGRQFCSLVLLRDSCTPRSTRRQARCCQCDNNTGWLGAIVDASWSRCICASPSVRRQVWRVLRRYFGFGRSSHWCFASCSLTAARWRICLAFAGARSGGGCHGLPQPLASSVFQKTPADLSERAEMYLAFARTFPLRAIKGLLRKLCLSVFSLRDLSRPSAFLERLNLHL